MVAGSRTPPAKSSVSKNKRSERRLRLLSMVWGIASRQANV